LIIATIHQPSTLMFQSFDKLMLMRNGSQIFLENAQFVVPYMKNLGIKVDDRMNPADFVMLEISAYK
jgi:ABC-type multidrug transport system ATPase subunit